MKNWLTISLVLAAATAALGQSRTFSKADALRDWQALWLEIEHVAAGYAPNTADSALFRELTTQLEQMPERVSDVAFLRLTKSLVGHVLDDEHSGVDLPDSAMVGRWALPFVAEWRGDALVVKSALTEQAGLKEGDVLRSIGGRSVQEVATACEALANGLPEQSRLKTASELGYLYPLIFESKPTYRVATTEGDVTVAGMAYPDWEKAWRKARNRSACSEPITYTRIGEVAYLDYCSFAVYTDSAYRVLERRVSEIFAQIKADKVKQLVIDVSRNSGGNSACGNLLFQYIGRKSYTGYGCHWKRSDEYLAFMKEHDFGDASINYYTQEQPGHVFKYPPYKQSLPRKVPNRFRGDVYVVVGPGTFSSAILFATIVKDNKMAPIVGEMPIFGHPTHIGEMYNNTLPSTGLEFRFGVKKWIRPSGDLSDNVLTPDIPISLPTRQTPQQLVEAILREK